MATGKFATSITCMDGRIQLPLISWIKENYDVDFVDTVTEPGVDKIVFENSNLDSIKFKVEISLNKHKSNLIFLSGHYDCAGNPVSNEEHLNHIKKGIDIINSWNYDVSVVGLWVDENWQVQRIE